MIPAKFNPQTKFLHSDFPIFDWRCRGFIGCFSRYLLRLINHFLNHHRFGKGPHGYKKGMFYMRKNSGQSKKWLSIFCSLLLIGCLLAGCQSTVDDPGQLQPSETAKPTDIPETTQNTQTTEAEPTDTAPEDPSLVIFRQTMIETPQLFAAAFFGYAPQESDVGADPFTVMQEAAPQLCKDLPFLLAIDPDHILGVEGQLFSIVPADENATVAVNRVNWNAETESYESAETIYRSESSAPILLMCNTSGQEPDTEVIITDSNGNVAVWYPHMDSSYSLATLYNDSGESLIFDFTSYDELPNPGWNQGIDSSNLVGTWEQTWAEVEGDRNEIAPGVCTIVITPDEAGFFRFTYTNKDFPEENIQDRELIVAPGELYPGCSNDQWVGKVTEESGDILCYTLTLLEDGTLLLQLYWEMDGIPAASYGGYEKIG